MTLNSSWEGAFQILSQLQLTERRMGGEILTGDPPPLSSPFPEQEHLFPLLHCFSPTTSQEFNFISACKSYAAFRCVPKMAIGFFFSPKAALQLCAFSHITKGWKFPLTHC